MASYVVLLLIMMITSFLPLPYRCSAGGLISHNCSIGLNYSSDNRYKYNLDNLLHNMTSESLRTGFYEHTEGEGTNDQVYGSYLCQGDLSPQNCSKCVNTAVTVILDNCPNQIAAQIWYDECILQFSGDNFFGTWLTDYMTWCGYGKYIDLALFEDVLTQTLTQVAKSASEDQTPLRKFATMEVNLTFVDSSPTLYTLAQCVPDLSPEICLQCLTRSITTDLPQWCNRTTSGRTLSSSCIVRYGIDRFYAEAPALAPTQPPALPPRVSFLVAPTQAIVVDIRKRHPFTVLGIVGIPATVVILLTLGIGLGAWCYNSKEKASNIPQHIVNTPTDLEEITTAESLQLDFDQVCAATQNFAPENKLGQGGFGDVFKGKLENGQEIAVKRLTNSDSRQGIAEFKNEVVLVAKLQHRNLVKLLGFCLSEIEKILVFEYLPNSSLDKVLFDPVKRASLDWEKRFNIICGIAKGLLYLHEDSRLRIIHRDLKSSNILLDQDMNAKISDFGIAKTLAFDQTRASTGTLVGTYVYMAPEYVLTGQYSLKSDIYSFGILVLEIVTGQRNRFHGGPFYEEALLHRAWRLWNNNTELEIVDSALNDDFSTEEVLKCIHIALLCIQEDPEKRPKMTSVVTALSGKSIDLPSPTPPNFFNNISSVSTPIDSTQASTEAASITQSSLPSNPVDDIV